MSEDRPQYQAERDTVPTHAEIAERLRTMANDMVSLGVDMEYAGGFGSVGRFGVTLYSGAARLRDWAQEIEGAQG